MGIFREDARTTELHPALRHVLRSASLPGMVSSVRSAIVIRFRTEGVRW
jgi:hypothetical protein